MTKTLRLAVMSIATLVYFTSFFSSVLPSAYSSKSLKKLLFWIKIYSITFGAPIINMRVTHLKQNTFTWSFNSGVYGCQKLA